MRKSGLMSLVLCVMLVAVPRFGFAGSPPQPSQPSQTPPAAEQTAGTVLMTNSPRLNIPGGVPSVFGYPGTKCPVGSTPYKGPETQVALETGTIYCAFQRRVIVRPKSLNEGKCPGKNYVDPKYKPDSDTVWCEPPPNAK